MHSQDFWKAEVGENHLPAAALTRIISFNPYNNPQVEALLPLLANSTLQATMRRHGFSASSLQLHG